MADDDLVERVKAAYRRHFEETKNSTESHNRTLVEIVGEYDPEASEDRQKLRSRVLRILIKEHQQIEVDLKDPFSMAVEAAMRDLKADHVAEEVRAQVRHNEEARRERVQQEKNLDFPKGPKEWTPNKAKREEELERALDRDREKHPDDMTLYIMFDDKGALEGWKIDYPDYWQGHSGPTADVPASEDVDYYEIRRAIGETLHDLDWEEIERELEEENDA